MKVFACLLLVFFLPAQAAFALSGVLTVYIPSEDADYTLNQTLMAAIKSLRINNDDLVIDALEVDDYSHSDDFKKRLTTELMAGGGPDVILIADQLFPDVNKVIKSNLFLDMAPYLEADEAFDIDWFIRPAIEAGEYKGRQLFVPIHVRIPLLLSTNESLEALSISKTHEDMNALLEGLENISGMRSFSSDWAPFYLLPNYSGIPLIDHEVNAALPFSEKAKTFFFRAKELYGRDIAPNIVNGALRTVDADTYEGISQGLFVYGCENDVSYAIYMCYLLTALGEPNLQAMKTVDGGVLATIDEALAINVNTKNPQAAYAFIRLALSRYIQHPEILPARSVPVRIDGWKERIERAARNYVGARLNVNGGRILAARLPDEVYDYLYTLPEKVTECTFSASSGVSNKYYECMEPYFTGKTDLTAALDDLKFKLALYASE